MPKNKFGGNKAKRGKNQQESSSDVVIFKTVDQEYAKITKVLGNCRLLLDCCDGTERIGHIRGKLRKKVWMSLGDTVLISTRDYQDNKCDILHKYSESDVRKLSTYKEVVPEEKEEENVCAFDFDEI
jgi:translation initiation factor 1A